MSFAASDNVWSLFGELDNDTLQDLLMACHSTPPAEDTLLLLASTGGLCLTALGVAQELRRLTHLEIRAIGECKSAAVDLLQSGALRTCYPHTAFMTHPATYPMDLTTGNAVELGAMAARDIDTFTRLLAQRTKHRANFWRSFLAQERNFGADEALKLGLVDQILDSSGK